MDDIILILQKCKLFQDLPESCIRQALLSCGTLREFSTGAEIIVPQKRIDWFAVVVRGQIQILNLFSNGSYSLIGILKPSYVLGADLLYTETQLSPYYAIAGTPCSIFSFPREVLDTSELLPDSMRQQVWGRLITLLSHENMRKHYRLAILSQHALRNRILIYLTMQSDKKGCNSFRIPFSRDEMADFLCVNRSALSHELSLMEQDGLIRFRKNEFTLLLPGKNQCIWNLDKYSDE